MTTIHAGKVTRFTPLFWGVVLGLSLFAAWMMWPTVQRVAWLNLGTLELSRSLLTGDAHQSERAQTHLFRAADAGSGRTYRNLAWIHLARGEIEPAIKLLAQAGSLGVEDEAAYWQLGQLYWRQGLVMEAAEAWKHVVRGQPDRLYSMLWTLMRIEGPKDRAWEAMIELGQDAIARDPAQVYPYQLLGQMYRHADYEVSNQWFREALQRSPGNVTVLADLAANAIQQRHYAQARTYLDEALHHDDGEAHLYFLMGRAYDEEGQVEVAVPWYREALARKPLPEYRRALAGLYDRTGRYELALAEYQIALEQQSDDAWLRAQVERLQGLLNASGGQR